MKIQHLDNEHYLFGGKGDVWGKTTHIAKSGQSTTLCGKPMLSTNWAAHELVTEAGCEKCKSIYNKKR
jgi:hypothetical protein